MNRIKERRVALGMSQAQLSDALKAADSRIDVGMISRFENGVCLPLPTALKALETALRAPAAELFDVEDLTAIEQLAALPTTDEYSPEVKVLLSHLYHDKKAGMSRTELCAALHMPDRKVRELIEQARREGAIIINDGQGQGYYLSNDIGEIKRQYKTDKSRALSVLYRLKTMRGMLKDAGVDV